MKIGVQLFAFVLSDIQLKLASRGVRVWQKMKIQFTIVNAVHSPFS